MGTDESPKLLERVMEGNRNELDFVIRRGIVARGEDLAGNGQLLERPVRTVVAEFGLDMRGGAIDRKIPFPGARVNLDLMNPSLTGDKDLEVNFSLRGFLFGIAELLPAEVPIGKEAAGVACGEKKTTGFVRIGKFAQKIILGNSGRRIPGEKGGKRKQVLFRMDGNRGFSKARLGRFLGGHCLWRAFLGGGFLRERKRLFGRLLFSAAFWFFGHG